MFSRSSLNEIVEIKRGFYLLMKWFSSHIRVFVLQSGRVLKCGEAVERKVGRDSVLTMFDVSFLLCGSWRTVFIRG